MASTDKGADGTPDGIASGAAGAGRVLNGRYSLIAPVGGGGMATVYKARDDILGRIVAVKILREQYAGDAQFVARFRREAQAAANLTHPNIVSVYDVGQDGDVNFIVMEFVAGQSLKELIQKSNGAPLPIDRAVNIAAQILAGLEYAHRSGLIHRDIKPQNVLITGDGTVKVTDFGIAKSVSDLSLTEAGMALGTAHYFSPEQAKGERVGPQSDIYAVGVTLYEMLTGRLPFESENAVGLAYKHISEPPKSPRSLNQNIPLRLEAIVLRALAKDPAQRFATAAEMERALRSLQLSGQQATTELNVPQARSSVTGTGTRVVRGQGVGAGGATVGLRGAGRGNTGQIRLGGAMPRGAYPIPPGGGNGGVGASASARNLANPLGAPTSMAIRPSAVRVQGEGAGCSPVLIALFILVMLALIGAASLAFFPQVWNLVIPNDVVIPSPTPSPTVPTPTPTFTSTPTPTATATSTPTPTNTPISVAVPKLEGLSLQDATVLAKQKGFGLIALDEIESVEYPAGQVAQQNPPPGAIFQQTKQIAVRVSRGPPSFKLPDLSNTDPGEARALLEGAGLKVSTTQDGSDTIPEGAVIKTIPAAGADVRTGDAVTLVVSLGQVIKVPYLVGMENLDLAAKRLDALGLQLGNVTEEDDPNDSVPPGAVLRQNPPSGTLLPKFGSVDLVLRKKQ